MFSNPKLYHGKMEVFFLFPICKNNLLVFMRNKKYLILMVAVRLIEEH